MGVICRVLQMRSDPRFAWASHSLRTPLTNAEICGVALPDNTGRIARWRAVPVVAEPDPSRWESPPPIRGEASAMTLAILNEGLEFEMWLSGHLIDGALRVLSAAFPGPKAKPSSTDLFWSR
jgi:hypothetical protein